jgi:asparagine synthase (glutamine-hydrolysing)
MLSAMFLRTAEHPSRWDGRDISLGHKLVRSLPEDRYDRQPVGGPEHRYVVVADLRLDNRAELASDLGLRATDCERLSDSALAAWALETWDEGAFDRFVGVFAIAAWDTRGRRLVLAKDILGHRPLFFHQAPGLVAFASMPSGLHALPEVPKGPDMESMAEFLSLLQPRSTRTFFAGVERVMPAHYCVLSDGRATMTRYWRPRTTPLRLRRHEDYVEGLRHHLDAAVGAQLRGSDGAVGAHLSAGLDSTAVATAAARQLARSRGRVTAFTACPREGYAEAGTGRALVDESGLAAATAALHPNMDHVLVRAGGKSPLDDLDRMSALYGRPILNICNMVWLDAINDAARERGLTILLTGDFGNATLSCTGVAALTEMVERREYGAWLNLGRGLARRGAMRWRGVLLNTIAPWLPTPLLSALLSIAGRGEAPLERASALRPEILQTYRDQVVAERFRPARDGVTDRLLTLSADTGCISKGVLAWWGLDERDPTADRRLVEFSLTIPTEQFIHGGEPKALIKHALAGRAPPEVLHSPQKGYQAADWHERLATAHSRLEDEVERIGAVAETRRLIDVDRLKRLLRQWPRDGWERREIIADYRLSLLRAISAADFIRRASGSNL